MMNRILAAILLFLLHISIVEAASSSAKKDRWDGVPIKEIYNEGVRCVNEANVDSQLYYFGVITDRYEQGRLGKLSQKDLNLVTRCYCLRAMTFIMETDGYVDGVRTLMKGVEICDDPQEYYYLYSVKTMIQKHYSEVIRNEENRKIVQESLNECFRLGIAVHVPLQQTAAAYYNLYTNITASERKRNAWARKMLKDDWLLGHELSSVFLRNFVQAIDHLDRHQPEKALDNLRYLKNNVVPALDGSNSFGDANVYWCMADVFEETGQRDSLLTYLQRVEQVGNEQNDVILLVEIYERLNKYYLNTGDQQKAAYYRQALLAKRDSLYTHSGIDELYKSGLVQKLNSAEFRFHGAEEKAAIPWWLFGLAAVMLSSTIAAVALYRRKSRKKAKTVQMVPQAERQPAEKEQFTPPPPREEICCFTRGEERPHRAGSETRHDRPLRHQRSPVLHRHACPTCQYQPEIRIAGHQRAHRYELLSVARQIQG